MSDLPPAAASTSAGSTPAASTPAKKRPELTLEVLRTQTLSPHLVRLVLGGPGFAAFVPNAFTDSYVKILFPAPGVDYPKGMDLLTAREVLPREQWPVTRTYTVRRVDLEARELSIDFVVHGDEGLAGPWAAHAQPGDLVQATGPGGAYSPDTSADWHLFAGDESALPAIAAALEALPEDAQGLAFLETDDAAGQIELSHPTGVRVQWLHREGSPATSRVLARAVSEAQWPEGRVHAFVHGERESVKALRDVLFSARGLQRSEVSISGYWAYGRTEDRFQAEKKDPVGKI
ncbi:siderophore-interacting protein [Psychromicrobium xiongbiense]|uniref:siderophore-interacting protein n=1 Tax=Psychromicrobium xiongbiense TaxID=3051184 RepID=UPI0025549BDC|nr:siderophore-interacting protein [Psychromicrobium sp. YIM S02556]